MSPHWNFVKSAGGPTPPGGVSGLVLWYDLSDAGYVTTSGGKVVSLLDKSGSGNTASQGTSGARFTYNSTGMNSMATMDNAANDASIFMTMAAAPVSTGAWTAFIVGKYTTHNAGVFWSEGSAGGEGSVAAAYAWLNSTNGSYFVANNTTGRPTVNTSFIQMFKHASGSGSAGLYLNNSSVGLGGAGTMGDMSAMKTIGGVAAPFNYPTMIGQHAEILIYNLQLSDPNATLVHNALKTKWGV